jgi:catechol 2,3-dioxygenase-like lactoylglutathione lyase family enzyme
VFDHDGAVSGQTIDHLWLRVADLDASRRFYETIAPHAGYRLAYDSPERAQFVNHNR